jgi:glycosyltransferase involved in cell wall biosynthesis
MRIAIWHNLPSGGGKRALYDHVRGLLARGHSIEAWCPPTADQSFLPLSPLVPEHIVPLATKPRRIRGPYQVSRRSYHDIVDLLNAMDAHCRQCADEMAQGHFDVLFANACTFFRVTAIGRYAALPSVLYLPEPNRWLYEAMPELPWLAFPPPEHHWWSPGYVRAFTGELIRIQAKRVQAREEVLNARAFDVILTNSLYSRESIWRVYGLESRVCYLGLDTTFFRDLGMPRDNVVIGVGAFVPAKNIGLIIQAMARLPLPRPRLVWIANWAFQPYLTELERLAAALAVDFEPRVRVSEHELLASLNQARLMAYAPRLEPFGLAPLEANACGLPVVAVAEGGVRETIISGVNGLLVESNADSMAAGVRALLDDAAYANELGKAGRRRVVEQWSLDAAADRLEQALLKVTAL